MKNSALSKTRRQTYWRKNLIIVSVLLSIWFLVSFVMSIVFVDALNNIRVGGFRFGFWMAQQGSLYIFVILIFVYVWLMNRLDRSYSVEEQEADVSTKGAA